MRIQLIDRIDDIDGTAWNGLLRGNNPFVRHEFLYALERHGADTPHRDVICAALINATTAFAVECVP